MALDKLVDSTQLDDALTSVANAIRTKGGTSASLAFPSDFVSAIAAIPSGGGSSFSEFTATPAATDHTLVIDVGAYTLPEKYILFIKSGISAGDNVNMIIVSAWYTNQTTISTIGSFSNNRGHTYIFKANGANDYYYENATLTKSGSSLSVKFNNNRKFLSGATYKIQIYELDSTFFT